MYHDLKLEEVLGSNAIFKLLLRSKSEDILGRAPDDQQLHAQCLAPSFVAKIDCVHSTSLHDEKRTEVRQRTGSVVGVHKPACAWHIDTDVYIQVCKALASSYGCQIHCTSALSHCSPNLCCFNNLHTSQLHRYTRLLCSRTHAMAHMLSYRHSIHFAASPHLVVMFVAGMRNSVPGAACLRSLGCSQCCHPCMCVYQPTPKGWPCKHVQRTLSMAMQHVGGNSSCYARHASPLRSACWRHSPAVGNKVKCW
jgi:hypothetical protein